MLLTLRRDDARMSGLLTAAGTTTFDDLSLSTLIVHVANGRLAIAAISCMCLYKTHQQ